MRGFVLVVLVVLASSPVLAGELDTSSEVTSSGTRFTATWAQGCEDTSYFGTDVAGQGPNSCSNVRPFYCPIDSVGTEADWEQNCDECECERGTACSEDGTTCESCPDWCRDNCPSHMECVIGDWGPGCTPIGWDCRYKDLEVIISMEFATGTCYQWYTVNLYDRVAPVGGDWQSVDLYPLDLRIRRHNWISCWGGPLYKPMVGVIDYRITADGTLETRYHQPYQTNPNIRLNEDMSRIGNAWVQGKCRWWTGATSYESATFDVPDGGSRTWSGLECCGFLGCTHGGDIRLQRSPSGVLTCDVPEESTWGSGGSLRVDRCIG